jgi:DNA-binding GntR family transcriptional regulator
MTPEKPSPAIQNRTLREQVFDHLREEILSNRLAPGTELHEVALAESLGISRGPLREALGRLAAEGLVTMTPRRGAVVTRFTRKEFVDAYQVRAALEALAISLAVPRLDPDQLGRLHELHATMVAQAEKKDEEAFFRANREFHRLLVVASGNERLQAMHEQLINQMGRLLSKSLELRGNLEQSVAEHSAILAAVDQGDAAEAQRLMAEHIQVPSRVIDSPAVQELFEPTAELPANT